MKPIIGILGEVDAEKSTIVQTAYLNSIEKSGGAPILLPYVTEKETLERYVSLCDGFLFTGGGDVHPNRYGEAMKETCGTPDVMRDELELAVFASAYKAGKPILAICRGIQLVNVALGGTLYQDLPTEYPVKLFHRQKEPKFSPSHDVKIIENTPLHTLIGAEEMTANSFHHQAVKTIGEGLAVMAYSEDGIIEAAYGTGSSFLRAYQWHPERLADKNEQNRLLFEEFIKACNG